MGLSSEKVAAQCLLRHISYRGSSVLIFHCFHVGAPPSYCLCFTNTTWAMQGNSHHIAFFPQRAHDTGHGNDPILGKPHRCILQGASTFLVLFSEENTFFVDKTTSRVLYTFAINVAFVTVCIFFHCFVLSVNCYFKP